MSWTTCRIKTGSSSEIIESMITGAVVHDGAECVKADAAATAESPS